MVKLRQRKQAILENGLYLFIWVIVFAVPVVGYNTSGEGIRWYEVSGFWMRIIPFLILFLLNNYLFISFFLLKRKYGIYLFGVVATIILLFTWQPFSPVKPERNLPGPPMEHSAMPPPFRSQGEHRSQPGHPFPEPPVKDKMPAKPVPFRWSPVFNDWLVAILLVGFNTAIHLLFKSIRDDRHMKELESQTLKAELNYLKAQVNPHFFMNTLNNIHALIDIDTEKAKETVIELSRIMRYVLYDADQYIVPLAKEITFLENYISLMRIRYTDEVDIKTVYPEVLPEIQIPPLLLVTLIENAFKHGISYRQASWIHTNLSVADGRLGYLVSNSLPPEQDIQPGVGLENLRKRLILLYGDNYLLNIQKESYEYRVILTIPIEII